MDRIDLQLSVPRLAPHEMRSDAPRGEATDLVRARVIAARETQMQRCGKTNARLSQSETEKHCSLATKDQNLLERAMEALQLSARATHRILRVSRTIADLAGAETVDTAAVGEAVQYRRALPGG